VSSSVVVDAARVVVISVLLVFIVPVVVLVYLCISVSRCVTIVALLYYHTVEQGNHFLPRHWKTA
jgi:hypothetical protein